MASSLDSYIDVCINSFDELFTFIRKDHLDKRDRRELLIQDLNDDFPKFLKNIGSKFDLKVF
jgi:hypothetical protein